ncbi:serine/threonine-protein kinase [Vibrio vulnificus]|uniref:serine/threonine-protein kinase n=1 Tax=Vibrio harveyi TaxID=669 RepID=UPI001A353BB4|nr:serine/threonine-protein kinase [Vibrio harveyi]HAS8586635.1 serine/threonine protein kinase [Vibrio vulnificus]HDM8053227.1 serine/threonine protein kinase [Vibrio harveyi]
MLDYTVAEVRFDELGRIGDEGRNSVVLKVRDVCLDAIMAVKKIEKGSRALPNPAEYFNEARILYANPHPYVVQVNYACEDSSHVYIAMPLYKNGSLSKYMSERYLTLGEIVRFSCQFLSGLHNIHSNQLIHFDIKPDNILLSDRNEAMLSDFGLAKFSDEDGFATPNQLYGTHMPPEAFEGREYTNLLDIYQAGLTMYRMCVGSDEFKRQVDTFREPDGRLGHTFIQAVQAGDFPARNAFPAHIHNKVKNVITKCMSPDPDDRYMSAIEVVNDLSFVDESYFPWQYSIDDGVQKWEKNTSSNGKKCIEWHPDFSSVSYTISAGQVRKANSKYTKDRLTITELKRFLKE